MSEWRDFCEQISDQLTDRQITILQYVSAMKTWRDNEGAVDDLEKLLIEEFTGVRII